MIEIIDRLKEAYRLGEFELEGGSPTVESLSCEAIDQWAQEEESQDSFARGYQQALYELRDMFSQPSDGALTNEGAEPVAWMLADAVGGSCLEFQQSDLIDNQNRYGGEMVPLYRQASILKDCNVRSAASIACTCPCTCPSGDGSLRWPCPVHPPEPGVAGEFGDAYQGAREDLSIWKRRALEAEDEVHKQSQIITQMGDALNDENGPTFIGEPNPHHPIEWYREGIAKHWKTICSQRTTIEQISAALKFYADREHFHFESGNWDTVSGEPLNILWCGDEPDFIEDGTVARACLDRVKELNS